MSIFCYKKLDNSKHLGSEFKKARDLQQLSLLNVSEKTRIPLKYLEAIEDNRFFDLPQAKAYRRAYLCELCDLYDLNLENTLYKFRCEDGLKNIQLPHPKNISPHTLRPFYSLVRNFALVTFVLFFVIYLGWQVRGIVTPPKLVLYTPTEGQVSHVPETTIQGETEKESHLEVNGQEIKVNEQGKFSATIVLSNGVNTLTLSTTKKHGKTTTIVRHVVVNEKGQKVTFDENLGNAAN